MEKIYEYIFTEELRINPKEHYILLTNNIMDPKEYNEKKAQIMFETFKVPGFILGTEQILDLYSYGALNGIVIDSGEYFTYTIPFIESHYLNHFEFPFEGFSTFYISKFGHRRKVEFKRLKMEE